MGIEDGDGLGLGEVMGEVVYESGAPGYGGSGSGGACKKDKWLTVAEWW